MYAAFCITRKFKGSDKVAKADTVCSDKLLVLMTLLQLLSKSMKIIKIQNRKANYRDVVHTAEIQ